MKSMSTDGVITPSKPKFQPSPYQQAIFDWVKSDGNHNLVVQAVAGSGKTTTAVEAFKFLPSGIKKCFVAFNKHIQMELQSRLPQGAETRTYHALGLNNIRQNVGSVRVDEYKVENMVKNRLGPNGKFMLSSIRRLVGLCKASVVEDIDLENLSIVAIDHDIELFDDRSSEARETIFDCVRYAYKRSAEIPDVVDFDDMPWLPIYLNIPIIQYDFLLVDEFQDTNQAHGILAVRSTAGGGRLVGVGDRAQSIYRFAGADDVAMDRLKDILNADELPLSITYRCPKAIVQYVNQEFPQIKFEGADWAKDGKIENVKLEQVEDLAQVNDMILCRVNADLVPVAFSLIRKGIKASIRGRDIGKGLASLVKKVGGSDITEMQKNLYAWRDKEVSKLYANDRVQLVRHVQDKVDTILAISENVYSVADLLNKCDTLFSDDVAGVVLSSIHKAKGNEANRVFILRPDLLPHPAAKSEADKNQEMNLKYVAVSRVKENLFWVY